MATMKKIHIITLAICFIYGASVSAQSFDDSEYVECMNQARGDMPDKGLYTALKMRDDRLNIPARHCEATALFGLGEYGEAAERLEGMLVDMRLGIGMPKINGERSSASKEMLGQIIEIAAESWLLAEEGNRAFYVASQGVNLYENGDERLYPYYVLRGQGLVMELDYDAALKDFKEATKLNAEATLAWMFLARVERIAGDLVEAEKAMQQALVTGMENDAVRLEAGSLAYVLGDKDAARRHWLWVALNTLNEETKLTAQTRLQALELGLPLEG